MSTERVQIRTARPDDAAALLEIYAPYVTDTAITFEYEIPTQAEFASRIEKTLEKYPYFVAEVDGRPVGYAYAGAFKKRAAYDWSVETSIYVRRDLKRMGVGRRLYDALEAALMAQGITNVNACIAYTGEPDAHLTQDSVRFHEHLGYRLVGRFDRCSWKFDRWYDMVWMEKHIGAHTCPPPVLRTFREIENL